MKLKSALLAMVIPLTHAGYVQGQAPAYPDRPIRLIAPISPGGGADFAARMLAKSLSESFKRQIIVDNRPGGGSVLGTTLAANAAPDGYTVLWVSGAHAINAASGRNLPYDSIKSFEPVALFAKLPLILVVSPSLNVNTVPELLARMRANPGKLNFASSGIGSASYLGLEMLKLYANVDMVNVNYKGAAPSIGALLSGEVQMALLGPLSVKAHLINGKLRPLAVTTAKRSPALPDLPTMAESVPRYDMNFWYGMVAPRGTPPAIVNTLNTAIATAQGEKALSEALVEEGAELVRMTPAEFGGFMKAQIGQFTELMNRLNLQIK